MISSIVINNRHFPCELKRQRRRSITARIRRDGVVEVKAPLLFSENDMMAFLNQHQRWLFNHYDKIQSIDNQKKTFTSGEIHHYLGEKYELKVVESNKNSVELQDGYLIVSVKSSELVENQLNKWYKNQAKTVFSELIVPIIEKFRKYNVAPTKIGIRDMRSRWGSCSRKGHISLNLQLIKLPENCIRQVIIHEMCHLVYFNHQAGFYALMTEMMPDWKYWKKQLKFL
jgi:hypothetical protein